MKRVECRTVAQFEAAIKAGDYAVVFGLRIEAPPGSEVEARENSTVTARGNSTVTAWGNSTVTARENSTVTAWENSTVTAWENSTVTAWGNSTVTAWENSTVTARGNSTVTAWENSTVTAWGNAFVRLFRAFAVIASAHVVVMIHGPADKLEGGVQVQAMKPVLGSEWCEYFGLDPATSNLKVENIDAAILAAIESGKGQLEMGGWHGAENVTEENWCGTTHCRAGYAICLAGKPGFAIEKELGDSETAGRMIYAVSRPNEPLPDFYADNEDTMDDLREKAAKQAPAS